MKKINLLILFGGKSNEHEVSRMSVSSILEHINKNNYNITIVGITKQGEWLVTNASKEDIKNGIWENNKENRHVTINFSTEYKGIIDEKGVKIPIDCVMIMMHGKNAEDGSMQGLWEIAGIPYTGPGVLASSVGMDKVMSKLIVNNLDIKQAKYCYVEKYEFFDNQQKKIDKIIGAFNNKYPLFVKPANSGSSIGVVRVTNDEKLIEGLKLAFDIDKKVLIEEEIIGREIEVAVLGNDNPRASKVGEIISSNEDIYDYESKYVNKESFTRIVEDFTEEVENTIKEAAINIYKILGCKGLSRIDFFYTNDNEIVFNEINTLPGFTSISMYPKLCETINLKYSELIDSIIELAMDREK